MKNFLKYITALATVLSGTTAHADAVIFSGNDVKTLKPNIQLFNQAKIMSGTVDPTASATSAAVGSLYLNTSNGNTYRKLDAGSSTNWSIVGSSGASGINYVANADIESAATGYTTYADAAGTSPVDGTGGSPTVTVARTTTSGEVLRGSASLKLVKDAANRQGEGFSYDIKLHPQDVATSKVIMVSFDYKTSSGYVTDDMVVSVYDKDGATLLGALQNDNAGKVVSCSTAGCRYFGVFNTIPGNDDYRLIWHVSSTSAVAYDLMIDNVKAGPDQVTPGAIVTSWKAYTPTFTGFGTATSINFYSRRVGDTLEVQGNFGSGTTTAVPAKFTVGFDGVNGNVIIDTNKIGASTVIGVFAVGATAQNPSMILAPSTAGSTEVLMGKTSGSTNPVASANADTLAGTGQSVQVFFKVPIVGWSSSASVSTQETILSSCRVRSTTDAGTALADNTATTIVYEDESEDSCNAYNSSTGEFTAPKSARYLINARVGIASLTANCANSGYLNVVNGSNTQLALLWAGGLCNSNMYFNGTTILYLAKGEVIKVRGLQASGASKNLSTTSTHNMLEIVEQPDFTVFSSYNVVDRQYTCTLSGPTGWSTTYCFAVPYLTADGTWRLRFNLQGTYTSAASITNLAMSGVTFSTSRQAISCNDNSGSSAPANNYTASGNINIDFASNNTDSTCSGDVALSAKPTFVP